MFHRTRRFSAVMLWALILLMIVASMPRFGCVCANGSYKLLCGRYLSQCCRNGNAAADESELCACCNPLTKALASSVKRPPSSPTGGCCHNRARVPVGPSVRAGCCTPVVGIPVLPPATEKFTPSDPATQPLLLEPLDRAFVLIVSPTRVSPRNHDLPVPDLVIAHQVFLI